MAKLSKKIGKRCSKSQMARFMARNSKWPENIFYGQRGANMARFEKSGHQMANLATLKLSTADADAWQYTQLLVQKIVQNAK